MHSITIPKNPAASAMYSIASRHYDREILFAKDRRYAIVLGAQHGANVYTTHKDQAGVIRRVLEMRSACPVYSIYDREGREYYVAGDQPQQWLEPIREEEAA